MRVIAPPQSCGAFDLAQKNGLLERDIQSARTCHVGDSIRSGRSVASTAQQQHMRWSQRARHEEGHAAGAGLVLRHAIRSAAT
jgi:hypothetical protein